jgi:GPI ethanolamine phosphate transferase 2/3 subunit F
MATTTTSSKTAQTQSIPQSKPVELLSDQASLLYANLQPIFLISILLFSFKTLVQDPVNTLLGLAPTLVIIQVLYCILCLPISGKAPTAALKPGQKKKQPNTSQDIWSRIVVCKLVYDCTFERS